MKVRLLVVAGAVLALAVALVTGAILVAMSGIYNVAASRGHPAFLDWFLELGMQRSVAVHAREMPAPDLDDDDQVTLGAAHFFGGCMPCHGAPERPVNPVYDHMLPSPPDLAAKIGEWSDDELHWIVAHGLQYTGMPAWSGAGRPDEIWAVVAFLRQLPDMSFADYLRRAAGGIDIVRLQAGDLITEGEGELGVNACGRCHETLKTPPATRLAPALAGQPFEYLRRALLEYQRDERQSGIMEPIAATLDARQLEALAAYYARMPPPAVDGERRSVLAEQGRQVATAGNIAEGLPPCDACHGNDALDDYPRLAGRGADYIRGQLLLWQRGGRTESEAGRLMADIARRMSDIEIDAVAAWYGDPGVMALEERP